MNREKDPLIGRKDELKQLIMVLSRRNKPNAILVGEPGVGKTAIVEELARLLNENKIPALKNKTIYELDLASTVGGTK
jgi:ATP-dependent Clp protease ATP-binding subunit ClpA